MTAWPSSAAASAEPEMAGNPLSSLWLWLGATRVPEPWPEGALSCPTCHRAIAGSIRPGNRRTRSPSVPHSLRSSDAELVELCVVDGEIGRGLEPRPSDPPAERASALAFADACDRGGEPDWASMIRAAVEEGDVHTGHALALLYRRGPWSADAVGIDPVELRQILVDIVCQWPAEP